MRNGLSGSLSLKKHSYTLGIFKKNNKNKKKREKAEKTFLQFYFFY